MVTYEAPIASVGNIDAYRLATTRTEGVTTSTYIFLTADGEDTGDGEAVAITAPTIEAIEAECARRNDEEN